MTELVRRTFFYLAPPKDFEVAACKCGNIETEWSEHEHHLWCDKCQLDFTPEHFGVLGGPILINVAKMLGICFDRYNLETKQVEIFDADTCTYSPK